jgi:hypothetical protein
VRRELVNMSSLTHGDFKDESAVSTLSLILYKIGGLPCGSPPTLIPPLRVVCLESPSVPGAPQLRLVLWAQRAMHMLA